MYRNWARGKGVPWFPRQWLVVWSIQKRSWSGSPGSVSGPFSHERSDQWRIQGGRGASPRWWPVNWSFSIFDAVMSLWTCHSSFLVTENGHIWKLLHQYCENGLQMEIKSLEIHHLGTQKDAKLCLKCTKISLAAGLCPDPLGEL